MSQVSLKGILYDARVELGDVESSPEGKAREGEDSDKRPCRSRASLALTRSQRRDGHFRVARTTFLTASPLSAVVTIPV